MRKRVWTALSVVGRTRSRGLKYQQTDAPFSIVVTTSENTNFVLLDLIYQPVLFIDAAGPATGQTMLERFGLAGAGKRITLNFLDQLDNAKRLFTVLLHPPSQIFESGLIKLQAFCGLRQKECLSCGF